MIIDPRFLYPKTDPGASVQHNLVMIQSLAQVRNQTSVKCPGLSFPRCPYSNRLFILVMVPDPCRYTLTHTSLFERAISMLLLTSSRQPLGSDRRNLHSRKTIHRSISACTQHNKEKPPSQKPFSRDEASSYPMGRLCFAARITNHRKM